MIVSLRKRHLLIWGILTVILPLGFILAIANLPSEVASSNFSDNTAAALPELISSRDLGGLSVALRQGADNQKQIELEIKRPIARPALYLAVNDRAMNDPDEGTTIGRLGNKGLQRFLLDQTAASWPKLYLLIYDGIKNEVIHEIQF